MLKLLSTMIAICVLSACTPSLPDTLMISDAKIRAAYSQAKTGAAYMTITNPTETTTTLTSVSSLTMVANDIQLHTMTMDGDVMKMEEVSGGVTIDAQSTVTFAPGGFHIMFVGLQTELSEGKQIALTLTFDNMPAQTVNFTVVSMHSSGMKH